MNEKSVDHDESIRIAGCIEGSLKGLENFVFQRMSCLPEITTEDLNVLNGMLEAVIVLAEKHSNDMSGGGGYRERNS